MFNKIIPIIFGIQHFLAIDRQFITQNYDYTIG